MGETMIAPPPAEEPPADSFVSRALGVFISPGRTFESIARRPDFIAPLVLMVLLGAAGTETFLAKIGIGPVLQWAFEHSSRTANMAPADIESLVHRMVPFYTIVAHVTEFLWIPFLTVLVASIGFGIVRWIYGVDVSFKAALAIPAYAYLVNILYVIVSIVILLAGDPERLISNPQNPSPTALGFFLSPESSKPLLAMGGSLEIFTIWYMVLLGIGFSKASGRAAKPAPIFFIFLGLWLVVVGIKVGLATLG